MISPARILKWVMSLGLGRFTDDVQLQRSAATVIVTLPMVIRCIVARHILIGGSHEGL